MSGRFTLTRWIVGASLAAFLITLWVYWPCVHHEFLHWDDQENFIRNDRFRGLGPRHLWWMFTTTHMGPYQPISWITLGLDYCIWGMDPRGYHLTNIAVHSINAGLMVWVTASVFGAWWRGRPVLRKRDDAEGDGPPAQEAPPRSPIRTEEPSLCPVSTEGDGSGAPAHWAMAAGALLAGIFWANHPQRVESVAWVTERRDVMCGLFYLLCIGAYLRSHEPGRSEGRRDGWRFASQVCCLLALLSKATAVSLPVVLLVLDVYPLGRLSAPLRQWFRPPQRAVFTEKLSYVVFSLFAIIVGFMGQWRGGALQPFDQVGLLDRLALAAHSVVFYLVKLAVPADLTPMYPRPVPLNLLTLRFAGSGVLVVAITIALTWLRRRWPAGLATWVTYVASVLPVSGLLTIGQELAADRYSYLPSLIVVGVAGTILAWAWPRLESQGARAAVGVIAVVALASYAGTTRGYLPVWHDSVALWEHAVKITPECAKAQTNMGGSYAIADRLGAALKALDRAVESDPKASKAHYNRGRVLLDLGRPAEALDAFTTAIGLKPDYLWAHEWRGVALLRLGRPQEAVHAFDRALRINSSSTFARLRLAEAYAKVPDYDRAVAVYEELLGSNIRLPEVYAGLAEIFLRRGQSDRAESLLVSAPAGISNHPTVCYALARLRTKQGRITEAVEILRGVLLAQPHLRVEVGADPLLDDLRKEGRLDRLLADLETETARQIDRASRPPIR